MASLNRVILAGNLTKDPEVRYTPSGTAVGDLRVAVNDRVKQGDEWVDKPVYLDVTVWARQAETCAEYLGKGSPILIEGRLQRDEWEDKEGNKRSKVKVVAERVQFLGSPRGGQPRDAEVRETKPEAAQAEEEPPAASDRDFADDDNLPF